MKCWIKSLVSSGKNPSRVPVYQFVEPLENRRLLAAGQLDPTFGTGGKQTTINFNGAVVQAHAVAVTGVGKTVIAGHVGAVRRAS